MEEKKDIDKKEPPKKPKCGPFCSLVIMVIVILVLCAIFLTVLILALGDYDDDEIEKYDPFEVKEFVVNPDSSTKTVNVHYRTTKWVDVLNITGTGEEANMTDVGYTNLPREKDISFPLPTLGKYRLKFCFFNSTHSFNITKTIRY